MLVRTRGVATGYNARPVLTGLDFSVNGGERIGVLGPNGGGKTTLFRLLTGELRPITGELEAAARCANVAQTERSRLDFPVTAFDVALLGSIPRLPWWGRPRRSERHRGGGALATFVLSA